MSDAVLTLAVPHHVLTASSLYVSLACLQPQPGEKRRLNSLASTLALLTQQLLPALSAAGGWQPDQIQLLGFSQGGSVALELARCCTGSQRLGG